MKHPGSRLRLIEWAARLPAPLRGALWMVTACAFLSLLTALVRLATKEAHPFEVAFLRNAFVLLFMLPMMLRRGWKNLRTDRPWTHVLRNAFGVANMLCWFTAFSTMPVADAMALSFTSPLFAAAGAALLLHELVRPRRWGGIAVGFLGTAVILRPGFQALSEPAVLMLAGSLLAAGAILTTKFLSGRDHPDVIVFYMGLMMTPMSLLPALAVWTTPSIETVLWSAAVGLAATLGNLAHVRAFASTDASAVLPLDFTKLVFATFYGFVIFAELPDLWTWVGGAIIFGANLFIARAESREKPH